MENKKWLRFVESFILLPILTISNAPVGPISQAVVGIVNTPSVVTLKQNIEASGLSGVNNAVDQELEAKKAKAKAEAIDAYFRERNMPLEGTGMKMVIEAEKHNLDWRLLPAISVRESTGGKNSCKRVSNNSFGWASCKIGFKSNDEAIEILAKNLGGKNPNTAYHYDNKTTLQILRAYNPPSIVPRYAQQVISIMNNIGAEDMTSPITLATTINA